MKQHNAINIILEGLVNNNLIIACYLSGYIVTSPNIDGIVEVNLVISKNHLQDFKNNYIKILSSYNEILFINEENNNIICVYEDDVSIDIKYYLEDEALNSDSYLKIYDPSNILLGKLDNNLPKKDIAVLINDFTFKLNKFYYQYLNNNKVFAFKISLDIFNLYTLIVLNYKNEKLENLTNNSKYHEVLKTLNFNNFLIAIYTMTIDINSLIGNLPINLAQKINYDYFLRVKKLIFGLIEE